MDTIRKRHDFYTRESVKCKCGHSVFLPENDPVKICTFCNRYVFRNKKEEFKFKIAKKERAVSRG